jgi:hypothetical protein
MSGRILHYVAVGLIAGVLVFTVAHGIVKLSRWAEQTECVRLRVDVSEQEKVLNHCDKTGVCIVTAGDALKFYQSAKVVRERCVNVAEEE